MTKSYLILMTIFILSASIFAQNWIVEPVDSTNIPITCSIAIDNQNYPHIAYVWGHALTPRLYSNWLKYARWNGITWESQPVETIVASSGPTYAIAKLYIDGQNHSHIAYSIDSLGLGYGGELKYAYNDGNSWQISTICNSSDSLIVGRMNMAMFNDTIPYISYGFIDYSDSTEGIRYTYKSGASWLTQTAWQENKIPSSAYPFSSAIDIDSAGYPVIAFGTYYHPPDSGYLFCTRFNGHNWDIDTIEYGWWYQYGLSSLIIDGANRIHIFCSSAWLMLYAVEINDTWDIDHVGAGWQGDMLLDGDKPKVVYGSNWDTPKYAYKIDSIWQHETIEPNHICVYSAIAKDNTKDCECRIHVSYIRHMDVGLRSNLCYAQRNPPAIEEKGVQLSYESKVPVEIYPNPARSFLAIRLPLSADRQILKIFDVSGKMIKSVEKITSAQSHKQEVRISLKEISPGIYFLRLGKETKKFLVVK